MIQGYRIHSEYSVLEQYQRSLKEYNEAYQLKHNLFRCDSMSELRYTHILNTIKRAPVSLLDVGYANGAFLSYCAQQGVSTFGFDVAPLDPPPPSTRIYDLTQGEFDVITFYDSLEHTQDIGEVIRTLAPCAFVVISVPALRDFGYTDEWFETWKHRRPDEHPWHFSFYSLIGFMKQFGFEAISVTSVEDAIRKPVDDNPNILTGVFRDRRRG